MAGLGISRKSSKAKAGDNRLDLLTEIAKINRDLRRGDLTGEQRSSLLKKRDELESKL